MDLNLDPSNKEKMNESDRIVTIFDPSIQSTSHRDYEVSQGTGLQEARWDLKSRGLDPSPTARL